MNKDINYEKNNEILFYNENNKIEKGIKCKNFDLCDNILLINHYDKFKNYLCQICDLPLGFGWNELEFFEDNEKCILCNNKIKKVKFPTNCGHSFCIKCSRDILIWDETKYHLSPELYGCPPCPNKCNNPKRGKQCYCKEYENIIHKWENDNPDKYKEWNVADCLSCETIGIGNIYASRRCPICRTKYKRK